jgi:hypothetical protein
MRWSLQSCSVAAQESTRGAGLGNEVIPWAKAFIAARELNLELSSPAWMFNAYGLGSAFGWTRSSLAASEMIARSPRSVEVTEEMYRKTGESDYGRAIRQLSAEHRWRERRHLTLVHRGMWGGYLAVRSAREFVRGQLLAAPGVAQHLSSVYEDDSLVNIVLHVRLGDFQTEPPGPGEFNRSVPLSWYTSVIDALEELLPARSWRGLVVSNAGPSDLRPLLENPHVQFASSIRQGPSSAADDLAVAAAADLLVCSVSSFSMAAGFLSTAPYIWYRPQLTPVGDWLSLWGAEEAQQVKGSPTQENLRHASRDAIGRAIAFDTGGQLPPRLATDLLRRRRSRAYENDLLYYGVTR